MNLNDPIENIQLKIYNDDNIDNSYSLKNTNETLFEVDGVLNNIYENQILELSWADRDNFEYENVTYNWYSDNQLIKTGQGQPILELIQDYVGKNILLRLNIRIIIIQQKCFH